MNGQILVIAKTFESFGYNELVEMPEYERVWWYEKAVEYQEEVSKKMKESESRARSKTPRRK